MTYHIDLHIKIDDTACEELKAWLALSETARPVTTRAAATHTLQSRISPMPALPLRKRAAAWLTDRLCLLVVAVLFSCALIPLILWLERSQSVQTWGLLLGCGSLLAWLGGGLLASLFSGLFGHS